MIPSDLLDPKMKSFDILNAIPDKLTDDQKKELLECWVDEYRLERYADSISKKVGVSEVFRQYMTHLRRGTTGINVKNTLPWHAEGERQYAALMMASTAIEQGARAVFGLDQDAPPGYAHPKTLAVSAAGIAMHAPLYLWSVDMEELADQAPLPPHTISQDLLPFPYLFWSRDTCRGNPIMGETNWTFIAHCIEGFRIFTDVSFGQEDVRISVNEIRYGWRWPDDIPEMHRGGLGAILKRLSFLNSRYVVPEQGRLPRQWRKEATKAPSRYPNPDPSISIVKLRRATQTKVDQYNAQQASGRTYSGHWWVSGHHRAQWYPSKDAHEVIWIEPYLKGSLEDSEIKRVYTVVR